MNTKTVLAAIAIPVYNPEMSVFDKISFLQCLKVLGNYDIYLVAPEGIDLTAYTGYGNIIVKRFDPFFFKGIKGYNRLLLSPFFYKQFKDYQYLLIYQLDCYVFKDELSHWCQRGYDYIGAPWLNMDVYRWLFIKDVYPSELKLIHRLTRGYFMKRTGNGGLSLRKISSMINNLKFFSAASKSWKVNEDLFFMHYVGTFNVLFKVPTPEVAVTFSFDVYPAEAYEMNHQRLPFGCHGFNRSDAPNYTDNLSFWRNHIPELAEVN